jgi:hypothetical protein
MVTEQEFLTARQRLATYPDSESSRNRVSAAIADS